MYVKSRMQFGKWCNFEEHDALEVDIKSNSSMMHDYVRIDPVSGGTQCSKIYSAHEVVPKNSPVLNSSRDGRKDNLSLEGLDNIESVHSTRILLHF